MIFYNVYKINLIRDLCLYLYYCLLYDAMNCITPSEKKNDTTHSYELYILYFVFTPKLSLKRKLKERFKMYNIDEFRTSCISYKTTDLCKNLYLLDKKGEDRKIHSILTYYTLEDLK